MKKNVHPYMEKQTLESERLILRPLTIDDQEAIFNNINHDKDVLKCFLDKYCETLEEMNLERTISFCKASKRYLFAIVTKKTNEVIGMMLECSSPNGYMPSVEVGYALGKAHWNKGYGSEALGLFIDFLFSLDIHKVTASCFVENIASRRVMEKTGMVYEGRRKDEIFYHDQFHDCDVFYLLNPNR